MTTAIARPDWNIGLASNVRIKTLSFYGHVGMVTQVRKMTVQVSLVDLFTGKRFEIDRLKSDVEVVDLGPAEEPVFVGYFER